MDFTSSATPRGPIFSAGSVTVHVPNDATRFASLIPALEDFIGKATETAAVVRPELLSAQLARPIAPLLTAANRAIAAAIENARDVAATTARALVPPPPVADAAARFGAEVRASVRGAAPGEQFAAVNRATSVELAALLEADGALSGLSPDALSMARERALKLFHIERTGLSGSNPALPSLDRIVVIGTDTESTSAQADAALERHKQRVGAVETDEAVLQHLVGFISAALAIPPAQALDKIMAAG